MKFQCGKCEKMYTIDFLHVCLNDLSFKCDQCDNRFSIKKDLTLSSSSKKSKIICGNCGHFVDENISTCDVCNLIINRPHEDLKIDNYFYERYEVNDRGKIYNTKTGKIIGGRKIKLPALVALVLICLLITACLFSLLSGNNNALKNKIPSLVKELLPGNQTRKEVKVVIMKSGQTYYAKKVKRDGLYLTLTNNNGMSTDVLEKDVLQISKAIIEK